MCLIAKLNSKGDLSFEVGNALDSGEIFTGSVVLDSEEAAGVLVFGMNINGEMGKRFKLGFSLFVVGQEFLDHIGVRSDNLLSVSSASKNSLEEVLNLDDFGVLFSSEGEFLLRLLFLLALVAGLQVLVDFLLYYFIIKSNAGV